MTRLPTSTRYLCSVFHNLRASIKQRVKAVPSNVNFCNHLMEIIEEGQYRAERMENGLESTKYALRKIYGMVKDSKAKQATAIREIIEERYPEFKEGNRSRAAY